MKRFVLALALLFYLLGAAAPASAQSTDCPYASPYFVVVAPFPKTSHAWQIYVPANPPYYYPATLFLQKIDNVNSWTHDTEYVDLSSAWLSALASWNDGMWNSLHNKSNGVFFNGTKLGVTTFPGNILEVVGHKYRSGECWSEIAAAPYKAANSSILATLPSYELEQQTNMKYSAWPALEINGFEEVPLLYRGDSANGGLWLEDEYLAPLNGYSFRVTAMIGLRLRMGPGTSYGVIRVMPYGTMVTAVTLSPDSWWMQLTTPDGTLGWASLPYLEVAP